MGQTLDLLAIPPPLPVLMGSGWSMQTPVYSVQRDPVSMDEL